MPSQQVPLEDMGASWPVPQACRSSFDNAFQQPTLPTL
jgi:hypothetical protein